MGVYLHIPIHPAYRKFLRLSLEGTLYQFRALPFAISTAPVYKPDGDCGRTYLISWAQHSPVLRRLAYPSSVPGVSPVQPVTVMGNHYKPRSNTKSSEIRPSSFSGLQFLVMRFLTHLGIVRVPEKSQQNSSPVFPGSAGSLHYRPRISVHVGITHCSSRFSSFGSPSYVMRPLQFHLLVNWEPHRDSLDLSIPISHSCHVSVKWWMNPTIYLTGIPLVIPSPDFHLFSDASRSGWGAHLEPLGLEV